MNENKNVIAVIAGGGDLPLRIITKLDELKRKYVVASIEGFGPLGYEQFKIGYIGQILEFIKLSNAKDIIFCGNVKRPGILSLDLDRVGKKWLKQLGIKIFLGDGALLKGIRKLLEKEGLNIISPQSVLSSLITPSGLLTDISPSEIDLKDIARGIFVLNAMSKADIGQAVIVQEGIVLGIEAAEGTQHLIKRCLDLKLTSAKGGVLVKTSKVNQDHDIDLPTIGESTILEAEYSKLSGIAVGFGKSQIIDYEETIKLANKKGIFIIGI
jgi:DUF1009 family protein